MGPAGSELFEHRCDCHSQIPDTGTTTHAAGINCNPVQEHNHRLIGAHPEHRQGAVAILLGWLEHQAAAQYA